MIAKDGYFLRRVDDFMSTRGWTDLAATGEQRYAARPRTAAKDDTVNRKLLSSRTDQGISGGV